MYFSSADENENKQKLWIFNLFNKNSNKETQTVNNIKQLLSTDGILNKMQTVMYLWSEKNWNVEVRNLVVLK